MPWRKSNKPSDRFEDVNFDGQDLEGEDFRNRKINGSFENANLAGAKFSESVLSTVSFRGANLANADFRSSRMLATNFQGAILDGAKFHYSDLRKANLRETSLIGAMLVHADLTGGSLFKAVLIRANIEHAILKDVDLGFANFTDAKAEGTVWPDFAYFGEAIMMNGKKKS